MKEDGKPFMTSMTINTGMFKKFSAELHLPLNRFFVKEQNTLMLRKAHNKTQK